MPSTTRLLLLTSLAVAAVLSAVPAALSAVPAATGDSPTVYEVLESYGFPIGVLPKGVTSYELNSTTGEFTVHLNKTCSFTIQGYDLRYKTTITGTISKNKIEDLKGIQVKILLFWVNIVEVDMDGDELELSVGILSASFPVDNFYESPQCGCGFDCVNIGVGGKSGGGFGFGRFVPI